MAWTRGELAKVPASPKRAPTSKPSAANRSSARSLEEAILRLVFSRLRTAHRRGDGAVASSDGGPLRLSGTLRSRPALVEEHPGRAESVAEHGKAGREEGLLHLHEDLTAVGKQCIEAFRFLVAVHRERQICAAHGLGRGNIGSHEHRFPDLDPRVQDGVLPVGRYVGLIRHLAVPHHHRDLAAQVPLVEAERLFTVSFIVEIDVELHKSLAYSNS